MNSFYISGDRGKYILFTAKYTTSVKLNMYKNQLEMYKNIWLWIVLFDGYSILALFRNFADSDIFLTIRKQN